MNSRTRLIKLGGSLLGRSNLLEDFREWLARQRPRTNLLVVGGGTEVDRLREANLPDEVAHWRAIEIMERNGTAVADKLGIPTVDCPADAERYELSLLGQLGAEIQNSQLPIGWQVTSDSIAAWLVLKYSLEELVLLKSCEADDRSAAELAADGIVDPYFPRLADSIKWTAMRLGTTESKMPEIKTVSLSEAFSGINEAWVPKIAGELNGQYVKLAKFEGEYVWHHHENEDELFFVVEGSIEIHFRDRVEKVCAGSFCIVPRGVEHKPVAKSVASVLLFEPAATRSTGSIDHELSIESEDLERL